MNTEITNDKLFNDILSRFGIKMKLDPISGNKSYIKLFSTEYTDIWFDDTQSGNCVDDRLVLNHSSNENIDEMLSEIMFDHIKKYSKLYIMGSNGNNKYDTLFQIPTFGSLEELAIKLEMILPCT